MPILACFCPNRAFRFSRHPGIPARTLVFSPRSFSSAAAYLSSRRAAAATIHARGGAPRFLFRLLCCFSPPSTARVRSETPFLTNSCQPAVLFPFPSVPYPAGLQPCRSLQPPPPGPQQARQRLPRTHTASRYAGSTLLKRKSRHASCSGPAGRLPPGVGSLRSGAAPASMVPSRRTAVLRQRRPAGSSARRALPRPRFPSSLATAAFPCVKGICAPAPDARTSPAPPPQ